MKEKKLTPKQERFAQEVAKGTNLKESAMNAGYSHKNARRAGSFLANHETSVVERIRELQSRGANRATLTLAKHLNNLEKIRDAAFSNKAFGAAVTAEINRGKAAGLYIDRKEVLVNKVQTMSKEDIIRRIQEIHQESGGSLPIIDGEAQVMVGDRLLAEDSS